MRENNNTQQIGDDSGTGSGHPDERAIKTTRRQSLKHLAAGSTVIGGVVVGAKWHKPLVKSVILPAHAQASQSPSTCTGVSGSQTFTSNGTFTIPDCVYQLDVEVNGGGGGAGEFSFGTNYPGGNGEQLIAQFTVIPGNSYPVTIGYGGGGADSGTGGIGGIGFSNGEDGDFLIADGGGGGSSHFNGIEASGGGGGYFGGDGGGPNGGSGGSSDSVSGGDAGNGEGASGGDMGANGANGSVIISY